MTTYALGGRDLLGRLWIGVAAGGAALVVALAAVVSPAIALALVLGAAFVAVTFRDLTWGVALFTVAAFFSRVPGLSELESSGLRAAGAVLAAAWLVRLASDRASIPLLFRDRPLVAYAAIFFVVWAFMSAAWAESGDAAFTGATRLALNVLLLFIVFSAVRDERALKLVVGAYLVGAALTAVIGVLGGTEAETVETYSAARLEGQIGDPNEFAAVLVPALVFGAFLLAARRGVFGRTLLAAGVLLFGLGLFLANSRGGLVGLAVVFAAAFVIAGPVRAKAVVAMLVVGAIGFVYYTLIAPPQALDRITHFASGGGAGREDLWTIAWRMFSDAPLAGIGIGNFSIVEPRYALDAVQLQRIDLVVDTPKVAHNTYLHVLTELGLVGAIAFGVVVVGSLVALRRAIRAFRDRGALELEVTSRGIAVGMLGMLAAFTFISAQYEKQLWLLLGVAAAAANVARRSPGERAASAYDLDVREQLVEQLERRVVERMDALLAEQERLARRRAQLAARENELRDRFRELEERTKATPAPSAVTVVDDGRERELAARIAAFEERERALAKREQELGRVRRDAAAAGELERRSAELDDAGERAREERAALELRAQELETRVREERATLAQREQELETRVREERATIAQREQELESRARELEQRREELDARTSSLEERIRALTARELELARRVAEREAAARAAAERPQPVAPPVQPEPEPVQREPVAAAPPGTPTYNLNTLEARVAERGAAFPDRAPEWEAYLFTLRPYAEIDGSIPARFSYLVEEAFAELLAE